jgi:DNA-binding response OmpR family regulator
VSAPRKLLMVDDNLLVREHMADLLTQEGFQVTTAADGRQALDRLAADRPDVVLLDLLLPVVNGWQFLQEMRADHANDSICVVVLTGASAPQDIPTAWVQGVLQKPVELPEVVAMINLVCPREPDHAPEP